MKKRFIWILLIVWFILSIVGAAFIQLYSDEAYYWAYSRFMQWGYFDHPPMVALMIRAGYELFQNELGVRLFSVILITLTIWILFRLSKVENQKLFALLIFSIFPFHLFGLTSMPDSPLLFFTALFFLVYERYLEDDSTKIALILGVVMSLMLYSKYQSVLVILFTLASNPALLKRRSFWMASIFGAILFTRHLYWQYSNDFPSVKYHLVDRSAKSYKIDFTFEYFGAQLLYYGPFMGFFLYWASFRIKTKDLFEKALKYTVAGTLVFFFLATFKGRVEVNWTLAMLVPMVILSVRYYQTRITSTAWLYRFAWISIPIILLVKIHTIVPFVNFKKDRTADFRGHKEFADKVVKAAGGLPIVAHRYQTASSLAFYTRQQVPVFNINTRLSQYDLWEFDTILVGKRVAFLNKSLDNDVNVMEGMGIKFIDSYPIFKFINVELKAPETGGSFKIVVNWNKPLSFYAFTKAHPVVINLQVHKINAEKPVLEQQWTVTPESATPILEFELPEDFRNDRHEIQLMLETPAFGVIRRYPSFKIGDN